MGLTGSSNEKGPQSQPAVDDDIVYSGNGQSHMASDCSQCNPKV